MKNLFLASTILLTIGVYAKTNETETNKSSVNSDMKTCMGTGEISADLLERCIAIRYAASLSGNSWTGEGDDDASKDKYIKCRLKAPTNQDWNACQQGIKVYNTLLNLDTAMQLSTGVQSQMAQNKIQKETMKEAQNGNLQTAALQATADQNNAHAKLLDQQMSFYGGQALYLETFIATKWPTKIKTICKIDNINKAKANISTNIKLLAKSATSPQANNGQKVERFELAGTKTWVNKTTGEFDQKLLTEAGCQDLLTKKVNNNELFANGSARSALNDKALEAVSKAAKAGIDANRLRKNAQVAETLKDQYNDPGGDAMVQLCAIDPANVKCKSSGTRVNQAGYQAGQFDLGGGGAGQAFNLNPNAGTPEELGNVGTPEGNKIADITSPFADEASKASDLLDQAGGASYTSAGAGGGGGGVGGGGGGGGSASLGSDLQGADKDNKEAEIKTSKRDGGYGAGGGGGFQAMGGSRDEENPLKSLFDQDGAKGGIEQDRSVASEDIDNSNSALFEKISKKYAKVHGEKRIEANNLE